MQSLGHRRAGFTLLELSVALILTGLMLGMGIQAFSTSSQTDCYASTSTQMSAITGAVERYVRSNNRFPMPAGRAKGVADVKYGLEAATAGSSDIDDGGTILYGALPFQTLGLPTTMAVDCWGNKFTYAVTETLTSAAGFGNRSNTGGITINKGTISSPVAITTTAAYAVISHGENGSQRGAVAANYTASKGWCTRDTSVLDSDNCEDPTVPGATPAAILSTTFNNGKAASSYFDDIVAYGDKPPVLCPAATVYWTNSATGPCNAAATAMSSTAAAVTVTDAAPNPSGTATVVCTNGVLTATSVSCTP